MTCVLAAAAASAQAPQREQVLQQVKVPHAYYWREMYVPQATSGPSAVTWSPDGKDVIYSMQGSLWRQRLGTTEARQLTAGARYDYQPDWSPDGRYVAYSSYDGNAIDLRMLDVERGTTQTLLANGGVNLEPKWSPDGKRLAFVSTAYNARWHVFVANVSRDDVRLDSVERITEDRDSGLPRYYYSVFDHYISPSWSPDGRELILVSNRGHIYGTGGIWRMDARAGAPLRELHFEETERASSTAGTMVANGISCGFSRRRAATRFSSPTVSSTPQHRAGHRTLGTSRTSPTKAGTRHSGRSTCLAESARALTLALARTPSRWEGSW